MRDTSAALPDVLKGSFDFWYVADLIGDGNRVLKDITLLDPSFSSDGDSLVQETGSCTIVYSGDFAETIAPTDIGDVLAPYGNRLQVSIMVTDGPGFQERIPLGTYLISETPTIHTERFVFNTAIVSRGDRIDLTLKDLFYGVQRDRFDVPGVAPDLSSTWKEYQRLMGFPVTRTVADAPISTAVAYQEDKLQAAYDLAAVLDATACMRPDGTASMRPNVWPAPVDVLSSGDMDSEGTLISAERGMSNDNVYNKVVVRTNGSDGSAVLASAAVTSGPLRASNADGSLSPYRTVPYFVSSDYITTQAQATDYATTLLPRVSRLRSLEVVLTEKFNPRREIGDVLDVRRLGERFQGRIKKIRRGTSGAQITTVAVNP